MFGFVRSLDQDGNIDVVAGNSGIQGFAGDGISALDPTVKLGAWLSMLVTPNGDIIGSDQGSSRVRRVAASNGYIYTHIGSPTIGCAGDEGAPTASGAGAQNVNGMFRDGDTGDLYFVHGAPCHRGRRLTSSNSLLKAWAGVATSGALSNGDGGPATAATFRVPYAVSMFKNASSGDKWWFIAERDGNVIRRIRPDGIIETIAGTGLATSTGDGGPATAATLNGPRDLAVDTRDGTIYFSEFSGQYIRVINPATGVVSLLGGTGSAPTTAVQEGTTSRVTPMKPIKMFFDTDRQLLLYTDSGAKAIRAIACKHSYAGKLWDTLANTFADCPAGSFCSSSTGALKAFGRTVVTPAPCPPGGFFCPAGSTAAQECPTGSYCATGASVPTTCPAAFYCPVRTQTPIACSVPSECPAGSAADGGGSAATPSASPSGTATATTSPSASPSGTPSVSVSTSASATATATGSDSGTATATSTASATGTGSGSLTASATATACNTPTRSLTGSTTASGSASPDPNVTPSGTATETGSAPATGTGTDTATGTATRSQTLSASGTGTPTGTASITGTATVTTTGSVTGTATGTSSGTGTGSLTASATVTRSGTGTTTASVSITLSSSASASMGASPSQTASGSPTSTAAASGTGSGAGTPAATGSPASSGFVPAPASATRSFSASATISRGSSPSPSSTWTPTASATAFPSAPFIPGPSPSPTASAATGGGSGVSSVDAAAVAASIGAVIALSPDLVLVQTADGSFSRAFRCPAGTMPALPLPQSVADCVPLLCDGALALAPGSTSCISCPVGFVGRPPSCLRCPAGSFCPGITTEALPTLGSLRAALVNLSIVATDGSGGSSGSGAATVRRLQDTARVLASTYSAQCLEMGVQLAAVATPLPTSSSAFSPSASSGAAAGSLPGVLSSSPALFTFSSLTSAQTATGFTAVTGIALATSFLVLIVTACAFGLPGAHDGSSGSGRDLDKEGGGSGKGGERQAACVTTAASGLRRCLSAADAFAICVPPRAGASVRRLPSPFGGACTIGSVVLTACLAAALILQFLGPANTIAQTSVDALSDVALDAAATTKPAIAAGSASTGAASSALSGVRLLITAAGDSGACGAAQWRASSLHSGSFTLRSHVCGAVATHVFDCPDCVFGAASRLEVSLHHSCQTVMMTAAAVSVAGRVTTRVVSAAADIAPGAGPNGTTGLALLSSLAWAPSPVLTMELAAPGAAAPTSDSPQPGAPIARGYRLSQAPLSVVRSLLDPASFNPGAGRVSIRVDLAAAPLLTIVTAAERVTRLQLLGQLVGITAAVGCFAVAFACCVGLLPGCVPGNVSDANGSGGGSSMRRTSFSYVPPAGGDGTILSNGLGMHGGNPLGSGKGLLAKPASFGPQAARFARGSVDAGSPSASASAFSSSSSSPGGGGPIGSPCSTASGSSTRGMLPHVASAMAGGYARQLPIPGGSGSGSGGGGGGGGGGGSGGGGPYRTSRDRERHGGREGRDHDRDRDRERDRGSPAAGAAQSSGPASFSAAGSASGPTYGATVGLGPGPGLRLDSIPQRGPGARGSASAVDASAAGVGGRGGASLGGFGEAPDGDRRHDDGDGRDGRGGRRGDHDDDDDESDGLEDVEVEVEVEPPASSVSAGHHTQQQHQYGRGRMGGPAIGASSLPGRPGT